MERKAVSGIMLTLLLVGMLTLAFNVQQVKTETKIIYLDASNIGDLLEDGTINHPFNKILETENPHFSVLARNFLCYT